MVNACTHQAHTYADSGHVLVWLVAVLSKIKLRTLRSQRPNRRLS